MSDITLPAAAWLLTYALHSTLLLCAAALLARGLRGEAWRETLWKAALVGGLVTSTAQSVSGYRAPVGGWALAPAAESASPSLAQTENAATTPPAADHADSAAASAEAAATASGEAAADATADASSEATSDAGATASAEATADAESPASSGASASAESPASAGSSVLSRRPLTDLGVAMWGMIAALLIVRIAWRQARLWAMLRGRSVVSDEGVLGMMAELRRNAGIWRPVRLTVCDAAPTPLALGGGEICVPPRFLIDLDPEQQRSALAHELAHLARRDPAWHFAIGMIEAVFFFQPLNRVARLRLRESAEFLCDAWAARTTGSPLGLARCLAEVASWVAPGRSPIPAGTMAMAEGGSPLVQRVQRLTAWRGEAREGSGPVRAAGAAVLVLAVAFAAPAVASSAERRAEVVERRNEPVVVQEGIVHPRPAEPLARRWEWAVGEIGRRRLERAWIAYSVPSLLRPGTTWSTDSEIVEIADLTRASVNHRVGAPAEDVVMIFSVARGGEVERVAGRAAAGFEFGRQELIWLGGAEGAESFAHLRRLADGARRTDLRESLVDAIGMHRGDEMVPYLAAVLGRDGSNGVRRAAAEALGRHAGDEALAGVMTAVERDGSKDVRRAAVEAIGAMRHPRSPAVLLDLAARGRDAGVRRQAAESLGETGSADALRGLRGIALEGADEQAARQAVESMEAYPAREAAPLLEQIAWRPGREAVARQAAESLGRFPPPWAVVALDSIARRHPRPSVARQAVEALGGVPGGVPDGYLRNLARTHPDARIREEASDQLRHRAEERGNGGDPDPDFELPSDPDPDPDPGA